VWILVRAKEVDRAVFFEGVLCSVAVVYVEVYYEDFVIAELLCIACPDGDIVEDAKSHSGIDFCVMARWPYCAKGPVEIPIPAAFNCFYHRTDCVTGRLEAMFRHVRIRIEVSDPEPPDPVNIPFRMDQGDFFVRSPARFDLD